MNAHHLLAEHLDVSHCIDASTQVIKADVALFDEFSANFHCFRSKILNRRSVAQVLHDRETLLLLVFELLSLIAHIHLVLIWCNNRAWKLIITLKLVILRSIISLIDVLVVLNTPRYLTCHLFILSQ